MKKMVEFKNVSKIYETGDTKNYAISDVSFEIEEGELVVVLGPSGAGKSTILNLIGGMDCASEGQIVVNDNNITSYNDKQLTAYRAINIGFIFQFYNLIPSLTAYENVSIVKDIVKNPIPA